MTSWLCWLWGILLHWQSLLALGLRLLWQTLLARFGPISLSCMRFCRISDLDFFDTKICFSGQVDFHWFFGGQSWPFLAQNDLYPLLINLVVVVGCLCGSGRRGRHLLSQANGMYNRVYWISLSN